ncbi:PREDICTED: reticulon-3-B-like [Amphimedon queenslandica]|uniref:Reticulon-like protein n=1 Tax=Amphimedon queenslandica TaxID=400682 RepID=A0A1X7TRV3_AMPQE|nr:PREDICTED: reticulon-3-B-like [Amphimedon queenslandica]|eukprot:XP_019858093.1 PREDICTED: reticulon-3-B-like [Amphimedon queenslandica]
MADDYIEDSEGPFSSGPPPFVPSEESKESLTSEYIKVDHREGESSSPEMISGPEDPNDPLLPPPDPPSPPKRDPSPVSGFDPPPLISGIGGVEDIPPKRDEASFSRPSPKHTVETVRAEGYLSFLNVLHPFVLNIIFWKDIKLSSLSLVVCLVTLLTLYLNTLLHTVVLILLAAMIVSLIFIVTKIAIDSFYNRQIKNPFSAYLECQLTFINEEAAVLLVKSCVKDINHYANLITKLIFFESYIRSLKFVVFLFLASYLTNCFSIMTLLFLGVDILFGVPPIYTHYRVVIDQYIEKIGYKLAELYQKVSAKIPFLPKSKSD